MGLIPWNILIDVTQNYRKAGQNQKVTANKISSKTLKFLLYHILSFNVIGTKLYIP